MTIENLWTKKSFPKSNQIASDLSKSFQQKQNSISSQIQPGECTCSSKMANQKIKQLLHVNCVVKHVKVKNSHHRHEKRGLDHQTSPPNFF